MASTRGYAKKDILRAANNAGRIAERMGWLVEKYPDYPEFTEVVKSIIEASFLLERSINDCLYLLP